MAFPIVPLIAGGTALFNAIQSGRQQGKANAAQEEALEAMRADIAARQPFRDQLFASLQQGQPQRQDLSNVFQSENPFAQALGPLNPQTAPVAPQGMQPQGPQLPPDAARFLAGRGRGGQPPQEGQAPLDPSRFLARF